VSTKQAGDASEATVLATLIDLGYTVSIPFGDNDPYDLVVETDRGLVRVQVKTGWLEDGRVRFKTCSRTTRDGERVARDYSPGEVDAFAVRCRERAELYWVPVEQTGAKSTYLRVGEPDIDHPSVRNAEEFRFETNLPDP
jgi:hypothetical protein